jgi:hypothetical protein
MWQRASMYQQQVDWVGHDERIGWPVGKGAGIEVLHPDLDHDNPSRWHVASEPYGDGTNKGIPRCGSW